MSVLRRHAEYVLKQVRQDLASVQAQSQAQTVAFSEAVASDLTAHAATVATGSILGHIKIGSSLTISSAVVDVRGLSITSGKTLTVSNSLTLAGTDGKTLTVSNTLTLSGTDGKSLALTGSLTIGADTTISGGGTIALGGFTLTVPASMTVAGRDVANTFSALQTFDAGTAVPRSAHVGYRAGSFGRFIENPFTGAPGGIGSVLITSNAVYDSGDARWEYSSTSYSGSAVAFAFTNNIHLYTATGATAAGDPITWGEVARFSNAGVLFVGRTSGLANAGDIDSNSIIRAATGVIAGRTTTSLPAGTALDADSGIAVNGTRVISTRKTGWSLPTGTLSRAAFDQSTVTLAQLAQRVAALITDLYSTAGHGLIGA